MDTFVEQIVAKRKGGKEYAIIFGSLIAALLILAALWLFLLFFIGIFFVLLLTAGIGWLLWYLITMQNVEFEYSVTNGDIDIDQITAQRKRKRIVSVSGEKIETFAPYNAAAADGIPRADHPCRGTAGVFHQTEIIESLRHRGRLHQAHFPCSQYFHAVHLPFRIKVEIRIKRRAQRSVFSPGVILPARPLGSKPPAQPAGYPACG